MNHTKNLFAWVAPLPPPLRSEPRLRLQISNPRPRTEVKTETVRPGEKRPGVKGTTIFLLQTHPLETSEKVEIVKGQKVKTEKLVVKDVQSFEVRWVYPESFLHLRVVFSLSIGRTYNWSTVFGDIDEIDTTE